MALAAAAWRLGGEKRAQPQRGDAGRCEENRRWKEKGVGTLCVITQVCGKKYLEKFLRTLSIPYYFCNIGSPLVVTHLVSFRCHCECVFRLFCRTEILGNSLVALFRRQTSTEQGYGSTTQASLHCISPLPTMCWVLCSKGCCSDMCTHVSHMSQTKIMYVSRRFE